MARWYCGEKLWTTRQRSLYIFLFLLWKWLMFDYKLLEGNLDGNWSAWLIFSGKRSPNQATCSIWLIFPDKLSPYQGNLFHLSDFLRQPVYTWGDNCSTSGTLPDKLSPHVEMNGFFNWFLVWIRCQFEWWKKWLTAPFMVFPYMVRGNNQFLLQFNSHYFSWIARVKLVKTSLFQILLLWKDC